MSWQEVEVALVKRILPAMKIDYEQLEKDTTVIIYPEGEEAPLVAGKEFKLRRAERDAVLREALQIRKSKSFQ